MSRPLTWEVVQSPESLVAHDRRVQGPPSWEEDMNDVKTTREPERSSPSSQARHIKVLSPESLVAIDRHVQGPPPGEEDMDEEDIDEEDMDEEDMDEEDMDEEGMGEEDMDEEAMDGEDLDEEDMDEEDMDVVKTTRLGELERSSRSSQLEARHIKNALRYANVKVRNTIEVAVPHAPITTKHVALVEVDDAESTKHAALVEVGDAESLSAFLEEHHAAVIGGAIVCNISLLVDDAAPEYGQGQGKGQFNELPVVPHQVPESEGAKAQLISSLVSGDTPLFIFPEEYIAPPGFEHVGTLPVEAGNLAAEFSRQHGAETTSLDVYTVSGDIVDFWGIKGLTAKLHKHKGVHDGKEEGSPKTHSATEKVIISPESLAFEGHTLASLFPFIDSEEIKNLPIANLELTYSADEPNKLFHKPGLRLEVDIQLKGVLQWVGDAIKTLFGSADHPPTIRLSAWLSETRNWSKHPTDMDKLVLEGYFQDMVFKPWNILDFKTMGIELTATKSGGSWHFGFGFIGEVMITNIPEARVPVGLTYRIAREVEDEDTGRTWSLAVIAEDWRNVFGFENVHMTEAVLNGSFSEGSFNSSIRLEISGLIKLGDATFSVQGQFVKGWKHAITWTWIQFHSQLEVPLVQEDHFIQASIGDFTFSDIKKLHAQIAGHGVSEQHDGDGIAGDTITFKNLTIRASCTKYLGAEGDRKALELLGEVTVGEVSSYSASLTFATDGITIIGGVSNVKIPDTDITIEEAGLRFFMALKKGNTSETTKGGRESSFSVLGAVKYKSVTFKAGLHLARKQDKEERDWLVFGSADHIRLREIFPSIAEDSFLNLQLENVAIIASSEDRGGHGQAEDNGVVDSDGSAHVNWDVLSEIQALGYPVVKGFTICATISCFQQLEQLNNGKKIDGLMVSLTVSLDGEVNVGIRLPKSFRVQLSKFAFLDDFGASIGAGSDGPQLELRATLTVLMENSDPILVKGVIVGTLKGAMGELTMDPSSRWINPFGLNKELVVSNLGIGAGFDYATVFETGPTRFSLKGRVNIGAYYGRLDVGVDITKATGVLQIELSTLDVADIAQITTILTQPPENRQATAIAAQKHGDIVFSDLKLYLSSGAKFMGNFYARGIQVRGTVTFFGKTGDFNGEFTDDGVKIKGGLDAFEIGGLEVTSLQEHNGRKRATVDVELTKTKQRVFVDGVVRYHDVVLKVLVDVDVQKRYLKGEIEVTLAESLVFKLKGEVEVGERGLGDAVWWFEGELKFAVVMAIRDGILQGIDAIETRAKHDIDEAEESIAGRFRELQDDMHSKKQELDELRRQSREEVLERREKIDEENKVLRQAHDEIDELDRLYREVKSRKDRNDAEIQDQMRKRDRAQAELEDKKREMRREYDVKIREQKDHQAHWKSERDRLTEMKEASWGDDLRKAESAGRSWQWWCDLEKEREDWKETCEWNVDNCHWYESAYWAVKLSEAAAGLEQAHASKAIDAELRHAAFAIMNTEPFIAAERGINNAAFEIDRFERAVGELVTKGPMGYIEEMTHDERRDLDRAITLLNDLMEASRALEEELQAAKSALDEGRSRLSPQQEEARKNIADLEAELELKPFEEDYRNKQQDYDMIKTQADALIATLEDVKKGVHVGTDVVRQVTKLVAKGTPEIKEIKVKASSDALAKNEPLTFDITVSWMNEEHACHVEWSPNQDAHVLYNKAAKIVVALAA